MALKRGEGCDVVDGWGGEVALKRGERCDAMDGWRNVAMLSV